jgi:hypothetical protein
MWSGRPPRRPPLSGVPVGVDHEVQEQLHLNDTGGRLESQVDSVPFDSSRRQASAHQGPRVVDCGSKGHQNDPTASLHESKIAPDEEYVKNWLTLPNSQYCIQYELGSATTSRASILSTSPSALLSKSDGISMLQLVASKTPFELKMQELRTVLQAKYPRGAGLVYIREFLEPTDPEFPHVRIGRGARGECSGAVPVVNENHSNAQGPTAVIPVSTLSREQVGRLRLLIVSDKRRDVLISTLRFYSMLPYHGRDTVFDHFESFKSTYAKTRDHRKKLDVLLAVTMALHKHRGWMYRMDRGLGRSKMVESLATRWKNLLSTKTPEELALDPEFSYPAVLMLLQDFKRTVEAAPTYGDPRMLFKYEPFLTEGAP